MAAMTAAPELSKRSFYAGWVRWAASRFVEAGFLTQTLIGPIRETWRAEVLGIRAEIRRESGKRAGHSAGIDVL